MCVQSNGWQIDMSSSLVSICLRVRVSCPNPFVRLCCLRACMCESHVATDFSEMFLVCLHVGVSFSSLLAKLIRGHFMSPVFLACWCVRVSFSNHRVTCWFVCECHFPTIVSDLGCPTIVSAVDTFIDVFVVYLCFFGTVIDITTLPI